MFIKSHKVLWKKVMGVCLILLLAGVVAGCENHYDERIGSGCMSSTTDIYSDKEDSSQDYSDKVFPYEFTDALGNKVTVKSLKSVVVLYGSFAEVWINGGGTITGTTADAIEERKLDLPEAVKIVGTVKEPNLEAIIALNPSFVIFSADIENHRKFGDSLKQMGIPHAYMRIDVFEDYLTMLKIITDMTGRKDLYEKNGLAVQNDIESILERVPDDSNIKVLFLRAYSTGSKAKTDDNFTGIMLKEMNTENIAERYPSLLEELSIEVIIKEDPAYIFVTTMGNEEKALQSLKETIGSSPAWKSLSAVKNDRLIILDKHLYHYKPNARWAESYRELGKIIYPDIFG